MSIVVKITKCEGKFVPDPGTVYYICQFSYITVCAIALVKIVTYNVTTGRLYALGESRLHTVLSVQTAER